MTTQQPVSSPVDYATQLQMLKKIESLGGSAAYEANPGAFKELVPALDPYKTEVWTNAIKELAQHDEDAVAQQLKVKLQAEVDLRSSNEALAEKESVLNVLKGIESLGGSDGFEKSSRRPQATTSAKAGIPSAKITPAWGFVSSAWFLTLLTIRTNEHSGLGFSWGFTWQVGCMEGNLTFINFAANTFYFRNSGAIAIAEFESDGKATSVFSGVLFGVSTALSLAGGWRWV